jgi:hypothetical protein
MMENNEEEEEEEDDDTYPMYPEYGDTTTGKQMIRRHQMCMLMILVGSLLMQREILKLKRRG